MACTPSTIVLLAAAAMAGGCSTWPQGRVASGPDGMYVTVLQGGAREPGFTTIAPEPRPVRLGAGDRLGQQLYGTYLVALRNGEIAPKTRTVTAPDPFVEFVGEP